MHDTATHTDTDPIEPFRLPGVTPVARHDHMVRRFSRHPSVHRTLARHAVARADACRLITNICAALEVVTPDITFHGGRGPHTGYYLEPRSQAVLRSNERSVRAWEDERSRAWPKNGMIRLGDPTSLRTIAHEVGHHLVNCREHPRTPAHGKAWVACFDVAAVEVMARMSLLGQNE